MHSDFLQEYQRGWEWGGGGLVGSLGFKIKGILPNSDPFGQTEKGGRGWKNWTFFLDVINVWSLMRFSVTFESKHDKTQWFTLDEWGCPLDNDPNWSWGGQITDKRTNYWIVQHVYAIFCSELELKKVQTTVSKLLGILPSLFTWFIAWFGVTVLWNVMVDVMWHVVWWFCDGSVVDQLIHSALSSCCFLLPQASLQDFKIIVVRNTR